MQLWNYKKCREMALGAGSQAFARVTLARRVLICALAAALMLTVALGIFAVVRSEERTWAEVATHETQEFELTAGDCADYAMDMTGGEFVKDTLVMPVRSFTLETAADDEKRHTYYVYLNEAGAEGIFRFDGEPSAPVRAWLDAWAGLAEDMPEPVEIFGRRGALSIGATDDDMLKLAEAYDGKSFIDASDLTYEREVAVEGAEAEIARIEAEKETFEARRQACFGAMCACAVLIAAAIAVMCIAKRAYDNARRSLMAELGA